VPDPNDQFDFDDLKLPNQMPLEPLPDIESLGEMVPASTAPVGETPAAEAVSPAETAEAPAASAPDEEDKKGKKAKKKEKAKKKAKVKKIKEATKEEEGDAEKKEKSSGLFQRLAQSSPYTVMLFGAVVFLLIAVLIMIGELLSYQFDIKAKEARERTSMRLSLDQAEVFHLRG
jgi:hypothetical protein